MRAITAILMTIGVTLAQPAAGTIFKAIYTGSVVDGGDISNVFGVPVADLVGQRYTAIYTFDDAVPGAFYIFNSTYSQGIGGSFVNAPPIIRATLDVGSFHADLLGSWAGSVEVDACPHCNSAIDHEAENDSATMTTYIQSGLYTLSTADAFTHDPDFRQLLDVEADGVHRIGYGSYFFARSDVPLGPLVDHAYLLFNVLHVIVATAVPEPATWALMLGGFGLAGGALRRQRVVIV